MSRVRRRALLCIAILAMALLIAACSEQPEMPLYWVDGTRGCKEEPQPAELWSVPGAVPAGAEIVGTIPHKVRFQPTEIQTAFGLDYYRVSWDGVSGWLPGNYVKKRKPICQ